MYTAKNKTKKDIRAYTLAGGRGGGVGKQKTCPIWLITLFEGNCHWEGVMGWGWYLMMLEKNTLTVCKDLNIIYIYISVLWALSCEPTKNVFSSVQSFSRVWLFPTPWTAARQASVSLLKLVSIESVMPSNHLILCCPLLLLPSILPSIRVFSNESVLSIKWPKYWRFSFNISPSNQYSGLISFRIDWSLAVQGTLKCLLQHHSSKTSILQC